MRLKPAVTLVMTARNAAETIERALCSATLQPIHSIVLVDDHSEDDTVERARRVVSAGLTVVRPSRHETIAVARQLAIDAVTTPFGIWLDADDEWLPERVSRLTAALGDGLADFAFDGAEVVDPSGPAGASERIVAPIPSFMHCPGAIVRQFERSYVPTIGVFGFRTDALRAVGYDRAFHGAEDYDVVLRAIAAGCRFAVVDSIGYRIHAAATSLSRQSANQRLMCRAALAKHTDEDVLALYRRAGYTDRVAQWALVSRATFMGDYPRALALVEGLASWDREDDHVLEPRGPEPWPEGWRLAFVGGTLLLLLNRLDEAIAALTHAEAVRITPEGANNLAVALRHAGRRGAGTRLLVSALERRPDYADARINLTSPDESRITTHPLRHHAARADYEPA
jgi:glycosyl transferase family 2